MRRAFFLLAFILGLGGLLIGFFFRAQVATPPTDLSLDSAPPSPAKTIVSAVSQTSKVSSPSQQSGGQGFSALQTAKDQNPVSISFENRDGLAVAWGDVILGQVGAEFQREGGQAAPPKPRRWDQAEIPFVILATLPQPERVRQAIAVLQQETRARFTDLTGTGKTMPTDLIVFEPSGTVRDGQGREQNSQVCLSALGRVGGPQPIRLAPACGVPEILHEILHALGLIHEHSRTDRDRYIDVAWDRIDPVYHAQFTVVPESLMGVLVGTPFDPDSIMLYSSDLFSTKPGLPAIALKPEFARGPGGWIPNHTALSPQDRERVNQLISAGEAR